MNLKSNIKIAFCGAGGTGKSTSARFIAEELNLPLIKSASRTSYEKLNLTEEKVVQLSPKEKLALQTTIFDTKIQLDKQDQYVADRTILDHFVYCLAYCGSFMENNQFLESEKRVRLSMESTYTHLFYFPWGYWESGSDGIRQNLKAWQAMINALIVGYIELWELPVITVPQNLGIQYRNQFILDAI